MAITISGENNNDRILASDGVIDQISGINIVGVLTATSFTGDLTGDVTGNLTGNVTGNINNTTLLLQTGGTERVRISSNGKLGVGINDPQNYFSSYNNLVVGKSSDTGGITIVSASGSGGSIAFAKGTSGNQAYRGIIRYDQANDSMTFGTDGGTERLRIASDGTTTASGTSDGVLQLTTTDSRGAFIRFGQGGSYHNMVGCADGLTSGDKEDLGIRAADNIIFAAGGSTERVRITGNGHVNIGGDYAQTTYKLKVTGTSYFDGNLTATGADINGDLDVDGHTNLDNVSIAGITTFSNGPIVPNGQYYRGIINSGSQEKIIGGYISGTDTLRIGESMYLTSNGLGIGENSPEEELHITAATPVIRLEDSDTSRQSQIVGVDGNLRFDADNGNAQADTNITFRTDGTERLRIDSSGRILLGTQRTMGSAGYYDDITVNNSNNTSGEAGGTGLTLISGTSSWNAVIFGDTPSDVQNAGYIKYSHADDFMQFATAGAERLRITSGGHVNIGGNYTQTTYQFSSRGGSVDQSAQFSNTKSSNGDIHYIGITLTNAGYGQALFGHTGHTTAGSQAAWMGLAGDDVAGGVGVKCFRGGKVQMGNNSVLKAEINNSVAGHQFISQCTDNNNGFEIYQQHGSTGSRNTLAVYDNRSGSKIDSLLIRGDGVKITRSRGGNYARTYEFNYNDGAPGGVQTVNLATVANYSGTCSAVAEVSYVGVYGTANTYIYSGMWICGVRRASNNSAWNQTANETAAGGSQSEASLDIRWSSGVLQAVTVGPWMGWTVNVRITIINGDITVNV